MEVNNQNSFGVLRQVYQTLETRRYVGITRIRSGEEGVSSKRHEGSEAREGQRHRAGSKASRSESQEWYRGETNSEGRLGSKTSKG